jgi:hypothetical protein
MSKHDLLRLSMSSLNSILVRPLESYGTSATPVGHEPVVVEAMSISPRSKVLGSPTSWSHHS